MDILTLRRHLKRFHYFKARRVLYSVIELIEPAK